VKALNPQSRHPLRQLLSRLLCGALLLCATFAATSMVLAQETKTEPQNPQQQVRPRRVLAPEEMGEPDEVVRIDTDLIMVNVTVTDAQGNPVRNLRQEDFKLYEDDAERPVAFFNVQKQTGVARPVSVVFALDVSGSMTSEEMGRLHTAMRAFSINLSQRSPAVFAVMSFGMNVKTVQGFTNDQQKLERAFQKVARDPNGLSTHTYDAVDDAIRLLVRSAPRSRDRILMRRAVIVITDGFPVGDVVSPRTVIERANAADVSIYTVTLPSYSRVLASASRTPLPTPLDVSMLAERTGGMSVYASDKDYEPLFRAIAEEVTSGYVLAFYPTEEKRRDGRSHSIRIQAPAGLNVRQSRPGYEGSQRK
jgi:Ca-activated chloride channel family protein